LRSRSTSHQQRTWTDRRAYRSGDYASKQKSAVKTTAWKDEVISCCVTRVVLLSITTHTGDRVTILFEYVLLDQRVPAISGYDAVSVPVVVTIVMQESIADMHPLTF
jgi:hypothetical protein